MPGFLFWVVGSGRAARGGAGIWGREEFGHGHPQAGVPVGLPDGELPLDPWVWACRTCLGRGPCARTPRERLSVERRGRGVEAAAEGGDKEPAGRAVVTVMVTQEPGSHGFGARGWKRPETFGFGHEVFPGGLGVSARGGTQADGSGLGSTG